MTKDIFDTHKFLFTLHYEKRAKGHSIEYIDKNEKDQIVEIKELIVNTSPISCRVITPQNEKISIIYVRIRKIYDTSKKVVWDMSDTKITKAKVIQGY